MATESTNKLPNRVWPFIFYVMRGLPLHLQFLSASLLICTAVVVSVNFYMLYAFKLLVDIVASNPDLYSSWSAVSKPFWIIVLSCVIHTIFYRIREVADSYSVPYVHNHFREKLTEHLLKHSQAYFHNHLSGSLVNKIGNVVRGYTSLLWEVMQNGFIPIIFATIAAALLLWEVNHLMVLGLGLFVIVMISIALWLGPYVGKAAENVADREADIMGHQVDAIGNSLSIQAFVRSKYELHLLRKVQDKFVKAYRKLSWIEILFWGIFDILMTGFVLGFTLQVMNLWFHKNMSPGNAALCLVIAWDLWWRLSMFSWTITQLAGTVGRIQEALDEIVVPHDVVDASDAKTLTVSKGEIDFRKVEFFYAAGTKIINGLNLHIGEHQNVGLVGMSGVGKTTLCQLLLRNYDLQGGQILIDGQDIAKVKLESLREAIAVIPQDPSLFHRTIRDNISYGNPDATESDIIAAAKEAQAHDFIMALPSKYETPVGERGVKLSGGQRQRIAIARAILKNAPILLLDEATSSLDSQTERDIQGAFRSAMKGRTTIVVAHRLSTLAHLERIVVMRGGKIVEDGTLQELLALNGHFAELWRMQTDGFLPENGQHGVG